MDRIFKVHASQAGKIIGRIGLTDLQMAKMTELHTRKNDPMAKALTDNMEKELADLLLKHNNPELPQTAKTFLHEWYADDQEEAFSVYTQKGNWVEPELIDFMAAQLGFGMAEKNQETREDDYFIGTPDVVLPIPIVDVKAPWNRKTLHDNIAEINIDYEIQGKIYMHLFHKQVFYLFFGLMDTPEDVNYGKEVIYSTLPDNQRWIAYKVDADPILIEDIKKRVLMCREYLVGYDKLVQSNIGKVLYFPSP